MKDLKKGKLFYGWVIVIASMLVAAIGIGMYTSTSSVFIIPICDSCGFTRAQYAITRSILTLIAALLAPLYGSVARKKGPKFCMIISVIGMAVIFLLNSYCTKFWHFMVMAFLIGVFYNGVSFVILGILITNWFEEKKGLATGIAYAGSGLGGAIFLPVVQAILNVCSWQQTYRIMAVVGLVLLLPITLFMIKDDPKKLGLRKLGEKDNRDFHVSLEEQSGLTLKQTFKKPLFWMYAVSMGLLGLCNSAANQNTIPFLQEIGYTATYASSVLSVVMVVLMVAKIAVGILYDKLGTLVGNILIGVTSMLYTMIFAVIPLLGWAPWAYAVVYGISAVGFSVPVTTQVTKYFGYRDFTAVFSMVSMFISLFSAAGSPIMNAIYDSLGSYHVGWVLLTVLNTVSGLGIILADIVARKTKYAEIRPKGKEKD